MKNMVSNKDYLSRATTEHLKGYLAIVVLLHHIFQKTNLILHESIIGFFCQSLGYYCVSLFLFISGYGLMCSYNRGGYLNDYQQKRVLPIFIINAILVLVYSLQKVILGFDISATNFLLSFFYGGNIVSNGWYLLCIMLFYEIFYIIAKLKHENIPFYVLLSVLLYIVIAFKMPGWYTVSSLAFPFGLYYASYKDKIDLWLKDHFRLAFFSVVSIYLLCFSILFLLQNHVVNIPYTNGLSYILSLFHGAFFCSMIILLLYAGALNVLIKDNAVTSILSKYYLELYVTQGLAFNFLRNPQWSIDNDWFFFIVSVILSFLFSILIHQ